MTIRVILLVSIVLSSFGVCFSGELQDGFAAFNRGDYKAALRIFSVMASRDKTKEDAVAEFDLGIMYENGKGVTKDVSRATVYYEMSARHGYLDAEFNLGNIYMTGAGNVSKDFTKGIKWLSDAAQYGQVSAQSRYAVALQRGEGVEINLQQAIQWYEKAATGGDYVAQNNLAIFLQEGKEVPKDVPRAYSLFLQSAKQGYPVAQYNLALMYYDGKHVPVDYKEAIKWLKTAADKNDPSALRMLGNIYYSGKGAPKNYEIAMKYYYAAAKHGDGQAMNNLGGMFEDGDSGKKDIVKAYIWFSLAASSGYDVGSALTDLEKKMTPAQLAATQKKASSFPPGL